MLERLSINNIALINEGQIEFGQGFNVLSGETGAGKSLIIDSLSLLLGEKADRNLITHGQKFAVVEAVFSDLSSSVKTLMGELGLEDDDVLIIRRKISADGKNECRVNSVSFSLSMLKKLSAPLMDLHGQFEHQNLLKVQNHLVILDNYGSEKLKELKEKYSNSYQEFIQISKKLSLFTVDETERNRLIDLYDYQIKEIDDAAFYDGEEEQLKAFRNQVLYQEKIMTALKSSVDIAKGNSYEMAGISQMIKKIIVCLGAIENYFEGAKQLIERFESIKIEADDLEATLEDSIDNMYFDENEAIKNENRLDLLSSFKKKYGKDIPCILSYRDEIYQKREQLISSEIEISKLVKREGQIKAELIKNAELLSKERKSIAKSLENDIKAELYELNMKNANFVVEFKTCGYDTFDATGIDEVEFLFSANLGQPLKPLKDVASGGEMSRFMLAVKSITASIEGIGTLVFDEIDTGVSGAVAEALAKKLCKVSKHSQVICVTHLAQIASYANMHFLIEKSENSGNTYTSIVKLEDKDRLNEIARLLSGNLTSSSLTHAKELIESGKNFYKNLK